MTRTIDDYLSLPYHITLVHDEDDEGNAGWVAEVEELPGCISQAPTPDDVVQRIRDAMAGWISVALKDGTQIPEPRGAASHSGRFLLRIPRTLHAELAHEAEQEGVSLNQFAANALAGAIAWRRAPVMA